MKNLLLLFAFISIFSCKKKVVLNDCKCGEIESMYYRTITPNSNKIDISFGYVIEVKNHETNNVKKFKTEKTSFYVGEEFCNDKSW